jgi:hypothetical protein
VIVTMLGTWHDAFTPMHPLRGALSRFGTQSSCKCFARGLTTTSGMPTPLAVGGKAGTQRTYQRLT